MRIVNKKRFIVTISTLIGLIIVCITFANKSYSTATIKYEERRVYAGDTLWSISDNESKNNKYYKNKDIRYIVDNLKDINNLSSVDLYEGDIIKIPVY